MVAHRRKDTIYKHIATELSNGFPTWEIAGKSNTYESLAALTTGVNGAFSYGPHLGPQPKSARFAQLKWGSGATPVPPSFDSVMACAKDVNAFDRELRFFTPNPDLDGCYPVTMVVNSIFPHSYANLTVGSVSHVSRVAVTRLAELHLVMSQGVCWVDEEIGKQGSGVPAVKFWDWIYSADGELNAEQAIVSLNGVPLTLEVNNSDQVAAVGHIVDTIQCDHPPNEAVFDATLIIIIASCVGGTLLIVGGFASHVIHTRNQMLANPLKGFNVQKHINEVLQDVEAITDGTVATYIPELGKVPPHLFAIAVVTCDGKVYKVRGKLNRSKLLRTTPTCGRETPLPDNYAVWCREAIGNTNTPFNQCPSP